MTTDDRREAFYVGYLALPRAHRRFLQVALPAALLAMIASAAALAARQPAWGGGVWETAEARTWTGVVRAQPYPALLTDDGPAFLIVLPGKLGAQAEAAAFDGLRVRLTGYELHRDGRRLIELDTTRDAPITPDAEADVATAAHRPALITGEPRAVEGEILDSKCYIGAMKPGYGRGHKACATNCVSGGVPPMIVTAADDGSPVYTLLVRADGGGLTDADLAPLLPLIAEPVRVEGRAGRAHGWPTLAIDPASGVTLR